MAILGNPSTRLLVFILASTLSIASLWANDALEIDKAYVGATDAWRDVTQLLQDQIDNGTASVKIGQPFTEIGGDPAPGKVKNLIVDYRLNGKPYRLCLKEEFPVAFQTKLPSPDAETPGANPEVTTLVENISSFSTRPTALPVATATPNEPRLLVYGATCLSLAALIVSVLALIQVRQIRKAPRIPPIIPPGR